MENKIGKTLHIIGIMTIGLGILGSLILSIQFDSDFPIIFIVGGIVSFISGMVFIGFAEIISLLQKNVDKQEKILDYMTDEKTNKSTPRTLLQDIEENLPNL